jgi:hypothetical protein
MTKMTTILQTTSKCSDRAVNYSRKPGFKSVLKYNYHSMLATIKDMFSLGILGRSDASDSAMNDIFAVPLGASSDVDSNSRDTKPLIPPRLLQ